MNINDLILFVIGGSGSRFLRSLLFQLAAGMKLNQIGTIRLIIIDADRSNKNLTDTLELMKAYSIIRKHLKGSGYTGNLFYHDIEFFQPGLDVLTPLTNNKYTLEHLVEYSSLSIEQRSLIDLLLTKEELRSELTVGFEGRPNMGTIGLQNIQFNMEPSHAALRQLLKDGNPTGILSANARIFFVSSMFGGMGSSGMPLLIRKFNTSAFANHKIGALSYMPYYKIENGEGTTDSRHFLPRTQIAYEYYKKELQNKVDIIYYIGDDLAKSKGQKHAKGGPRQGNKAHYVEYFSISALSHFCEHCNGFNRESLSKYLTFNDDKQINAAVYTNDYKKYQVLTFIGKYIHDRFLKDYDSAELHAVPWVKGSNLLNLSLEDKSLLHSFFEHLLRYNDHELNEHSGMDIIHTAHLPTHIGDAIPNPEYVPPKKIWGGKIRIDDWNTFESTYISREKESDNNNITYLISVLENSFSKFYKARFK